MATPHANGAPGNQPDRPQSSSLKSYLLLAGAGLAIGVGAVTGIMKGTSKSVERITEETIQRDKLEGEPTENPPKDPRIDNQEKPPKRTSGQKVPATPAPEKLQSLEQHWKQLQEVFPDIIENPYALFALEDARAHAFLARCSLEDLKTCGILDGKEQPFTYMNYEKVWDAATARKLKAWGKNGTDRETKWNEIRTNVFNATAEKLSLTSLHETIKTEMRKLDEMKGKANLDNIYTRALSSEAMLAIFIQEIGAGELANKKRIRSPRARLEVFRMMLESGWQPQRLPAIFDTAISFGLGQMTLPTHNGLQRSYGDETSGTIEKDLAHHTNVAQQVLDSYLLALVNNTSFSYVAKKHPNFVKVFKEATDEERAHFMTMITAAYHNFGDSSPLRKAFHKTLKDDSTSLDGYAQKLIPNIKHLPIAHVHARNSYSLYRVVKSRLDGKIQDASVAAELTEVDPEVQAQEAERRAAEEAASNMRQTTLLARVKSHASTGEKMAYYTFTVPAVNLSVFLQDIVTSGTLQDIKAFNGVQIYQAGEIINIPITYLSEDLRERKIAIIASKGKSIDDMLKEYCTNGDCERNKHIAQLFGSTESELRIPIQILKEDE